jgi:hypothetical protein
MKRNILYTAAAGLLAFSLASCDGALDTEDYTQSNTQNFPAVSTDADMLITTMYANLNHASYDPSSSYFMLSEIASDDRYGGEEGPGSLEAVDHLMYYSDTQFDFVWKMHYKGIFYANSAIEGLQKLKASGQMTDEDKYNQDLGEAYFMRAFYYYQLAQLFGPVPLITSTTQDDNTPRTDIDRIYGQVSSDFENAINLMSNKKYNEYVEFGHATKWAAEAFMARVWLFYTGFYQKETMPLLKADGSSGEVTKSEVVAWLKDCIDNSGHGLVSDFRNLWPYTNEYTVNDYNYTKGAVGVDGQKLLWAGNGNKEEVFAIKYCNFCGYDFDYQGGYSNYFVPYFGFWNDGDIGTFPFGNGNGAGTVATNLWSEWQKDEPKDLRMKASILNVSDELANPKSTSATGQYEYTGYYGKKMMPVLAEAAYEKQGVWRNSIFWCAYPGFDKANNGVPSWGAHFQDLCLMRFADVLLMESELTGDASYMNQVRARAGLAPIGYSLQALQNERRHELAFEGVRWADIRRWHIAETALSAQNNCPMENAGKKVVMRDGNYAARYKATNGFFMIPPAQIKLSNGVLTQNAGWDGSARYTTWNFE